MQICISPQTDNDASIPPVSFYRPDALPATHNRNEFDLCVNCWQYFHTHTCRPVGVRGGHGWPPSLRREVFNVRRRRAPSSQVTDETYSEPNGREDPRRLVSTAITWRGTHTHTHSHTRVHNRSALWTLDSIDHDPWHPPFNLRTWQSFSIISKFSLVYLLVWHPHIHTPYSSSSNHCLLFAIHAHTIIATFFAVLPRLCHLIQVSHSPLLGNLSCSLMPNII